MNIRKNPQGIWDVSIHIPLSQASEMGPEKLEQVPMLTSLAVMKPEAQPGGSGEPVHSLGSWACGLTGFVRSVPSASQKQDCWAPVWAAEDGEYTVVLSSVTIYVPGSKSHAPCAHACLLILEHKFFGYFSSDCSLVMVASSLVLIWAMFINITAGRFVKEPAVLPDWTHSSRKVYQHSSKENNALWVESKKIQDPIFLVKMDKVGLGAMATPPLLLAAYQPSLRPFVCKMRCLRILSEIIKAKHNDCRRINA